MRETRELTEVHYAAEEIYYFELCSEFQDGMMLKTVSQPQYENLTLPAKLIMKVSHSNLGEHCISRVT